MDEKVDIFQNKVVVITGGSSGIGKQLAEDLLTVGARVIIASSDRARLDLTFAELKAVAPSKVDAVLCDIRFTEQVQKLADLVLERHGCPDILINNAGYAVYRPFEESTLKEILDLVNVNLSGAMRCTRAFLPGMIVRRSGRIVNISSIGGETIITPNATYCAAKHGMVAWTKAIRYELARFNVLVNVVCPAHTKTNFHDHPTFRRRDRYRKKGARSLTAKVVSGKILDAIRKDRAVTYVPSWQRLVVWALDALPFMTVPIWDRILQRRIAQLYEQIERERENGQHQDG